MSKKPNPDLKVFIYTMAEDNTKVYATSKPHLLKLDKVIFLEETTEKYRSSRIGFWKTKQNPVNLPVNLPTFP